MRIIFEGIAYDTDKSTEIVSGDNSAWSGGWWGLYRAPTGAFFKIVVDHDGETFLECRTLTDVEARTFLERNANNLVEKYFGPMPDPDSPQASSSATRSSPPPEPSSELLTLKPGIWGVSVDLKEVWRRIRRRWRNS
jgi:hypothetical protein